MLTLEGLTRDGIKSFHPGRQHILHTFQCEAESWVLDRTAWVRIPTLTPYVILGRLLNLSILSLPDCILGMIIASI